MREEAKEDINSQYKSGAGYYKFPRKQKHIYTKKHFQYFFEHSRKSENNFVRVYYAEAFDVLGRYAFIASKKVGNAVIRNKCRRKLKEFIRLNQHNINHKYDIVLIAKRKLLTIKYSEIENRIIKLLEKQNLLIKNDPSNNKNY
jgi:ribonuclease P protein component